MHDVVDIVTCLWLNCRYTVSCGWSSLSQSSGRRVIRQRLTAAFVRPSTSILIKVTRRSGRQLACLYRDPGTSGQTRMASAGGLQMMSRLCRSFSRSRPARGWIYSCTSNSVVPFAEPDLSGHGSTRVAAPFSQFWLCQLNGVNTGGYNILTFVCVSVMCLSVRPFRTLTHSWR